MAGCSRRATKRPAAVAPVTLGGEPALMSRRPVRLGRFRPSRWQPGRARPASRSAPRAAGAADQALRRRQVVRAVVAPVAVVLARGEDPVAVVATTEIRDRFATGGTNRKQPPAPSGMQKLPGASTRSLIGRRVASANARAGLGRETSAALTVTARRETRLLSTIIPKHQEASFHDQVIR